MAVPETPDPGPSDPAGDKAALRKADVWTGGVLAVVAVAMVVEALGFPLEGSYAGVRNAWYVSPALLPLIVGGVLLVLSVGLVVKGLADHRRLSGTSVLAVDLRAGWRAGEDVTIVALLLAGYIVGLVPRVDFVAATALFLLVFMLVYVIAGTAVRLVLLGGFLVTAALAFGRAAFIGWPAPRSAGQHVVDLSVWALALGVILLGLLGAAQAERRRVVQACATSLLTAVILAGGFKYFLLVPLPTEGWTVAAMDAARRWLLTLGGG